MPGLDTKTPCHLNPMSNLVGQAEVAGGFSDGRGQRRFRLKWRPSGEQGLLGGQQMHTSGGRRQGCPPLAQELVLPNQLWHAAGFQTCPHTSPEPLKKDLSWQRPLQM